MYSFKNVTYYAPENFTLKDYKVCKVNKNKMDKDKKEFEEVIIVQTNRIRKIFQEIINNHPPYLDKNLIKTISKYHDTLAIIPSLVDLMAILKTSLIVLKNIHHLYQNNLDYFFEQGLTLESVDNFLINLLNASSRVNITIKNLTEGKAALDITLALFKASKPKAVCASKLRMAFKNAIQMIHDETKILTTDDGLSVQTITSQFLNYRGPYFNELIKAYVSSIKINADSELPLKQLHEVCTAHLYNIALINKDTFEETSFAQAESYLEDLKANPEKMYMFYLADYNPTLHSKEQEENRSNLISTFKNLSSDLQEKYKNELEHLLRENLKYYWEIYLKQSTVGEVLYFFPRFKIAYLYYGRIGELPEQTVKKFNDLQYKYKEISEIYTAQTIDEETSLSIVEATVQLLNHLPIENLSDEKKQKTIAIHNHLKTIAITDRILWDAISACKLVTISTKIAKDLIILHEYCLKNTLIKDDENLLLARIKNENNSITTFYKELITIRLSDAPIHIQGKLIAAKEKEFKEHYDPALTNIRSSIWNLLFSNSTKHESKSNFNPQFTMFWMKNKNFQDKEKSEVSLFKRPGH